jgi:transcriptional regulator with XRE-family HTH domain
MMTIMEERAPGAQEERQPARVPVRRPASGIVIDPKRLIAWRSRRALSRAELAARISALGWADEETGKPVRYTRDAIAKAENGYRQPKPRTVRALCAALSTEDDPCQPLDLQPDGPEVELPPAARRRLARLDYNTAMREFALAHGFRYKDPDSGRVYYPRRLREAYAQHVLDLAIRDSDGQDPPDGEIVRLARRTCLTRSCPSRISACPPGRATACSGRASRPPGSWPRAAGPTWPTSATSALAAGTRSSRRSRS